MAVNLVSANESEILSELRQIPLRYPVADQVANLDADLSVHVVCVCRRVVENQF